MITRTEIEMDLMMYNVCYAVVTEHSIDRIAPRFIRKAQYTEKGKVYYEIDEQGGCVKTTKIDNIIELRDDN